ncbi:MAG: putative PEP-binding protein, partial [Nitrosotalea sp.]
LTQAVFSFSREDAEGKFIPEYFEKEIMNENPFQSLDVNGVGSLIQIAISKGRSVKPNLEIGICGEHGGDPKSIKFCHDAGLTYASASSHRVPIAILAAAQAAIEKIVKSPNRKSKRRR